MTARASLVFACALLTITSAARADEKDDAARAEKLFQESKALMKEGRFVEACPKLEAAQRIHPGAGTQLALALCHEGLAKIATALAELRIARQEAVDAGRKDRIALADEHIAALEPRVSRIVVEAPPGSFVVKIDGAIVARDRFAKGIEVDGGVHVVTQEIDGQARWQREVDVANEKDVQKVVVPAPSSETSTPTETKSTMKTSAASSTTTAGWIVVGVGGVALAVGTYFGVRAIGKHNDAGPECNGTTCSQRGYDLTQDAKSAARIADVAIGLGVAAVATGIVLVVTSPSSDAGAHDASLALGFASDGKAAWPTISGTF